MKSNKSSGLDNITAEMCNTVELNSHLDTKICVEDLGRRTFTKGMDARSNLSLIQKW